MTLCKWSSNQGFSLSEYVASKRSISTSSYYVFVLCGCVRVCVWSANCATQFRVTETSIYTRGHVWCVFEHRVCASNVQVAYMQINWKPPHVAVVGLLWSRAHLLSASQPELNAFIYNQTLPNQHRVQLGAIFYISFLYFIRFCFMCEEHTMRVIWWVEGSLRTCLLPRVCELMCRRINADRVWLCIYFVWRARDAKNRLK